MKIDKLLERFFNNPKDFTFEETVQVLKHYGFEEVRTGKTAGSRCRFCNEKKKVITFHKPHPKNIIKPYVIKEIICALKQENLI